MRLGNHAWLSLELLEVLCLLAEKGHAGSVRSMLNYPIKHCPDILLLGMSQINVHFSYLCGGFSLSFLAMLQVK